MTLLLLRVNYHFVTYRWQNVKPSREKWTPQHFVVALKCRKVLIT